VRKAEDAFEYKPSGAATAVGLPGIDRETVIAAVERYLASRGQSAGRGPAPAASGPSCAQPAGSGPSCAPEVTRSVVSNIAAEVVDRILSQRGKLPSGGSSSGYS